MRIARISLVGALLFGVAACQTEDGSAVAANVPPLAYVRYINAVPDTNNLTVRWVDQIDFTPMTFVNVPYRGLGQGGYQGLEAGSRQFRVFTHDPRLTSNTTGAAVTAQLADVTFNFVAGQYYTLLHFGYARTGSVPQQQVLVINDPVPATPTGLAVRMINAGLGLGAIDVFTTPLPTTPLAGAPTFSNLAVTNGTTGISSYVTLPVGQFAGQVAATGTFTSLFGAAAPAGTAGTTTVDPIGGATQAGTVLTGIAFLPAVDSSAAAAYPTTIAAARRTASPAIAGAPGAWTLTDSLVAGPPAPYAAGICAPSINNYCRLNIRARADQSPVNPAIPARLAISVIVTSNTANTVTTAADLSAYVDAGRYTYDVVRYTSALVWFTDRHPPRATTP